MDTSQQFTAIEWCAGYAGIHLGLKRAIPGLRVIAYGEIEAFACANLVAKMEAGLLDAAPVWTDIKTFPCEQFRDRVGLLVAGYPCQPFSAAGKRLGADDPRHLWPHIKRAVGIIRPVQCFFENVEGHISLGLREVIGDLESLGYRATWGIFSAAEVGAPHQRKRVFILAVAGGVGGAAGLSGSRSRHERNAGVAYHAGHQDIWPSRPNKPQHGWEPPRVVANAARARDDVGQEGQRGAEFTGTSESVGNAIGDDNGRADGTWRGQREQEKDEQLGSGGQGDVQRQTESALGRNADGASSGMDYAKLCVTSDNRTDELRLLGNGVVPAVAERAYRVLSQRLIKPS